MNAILKCTSCTYLNVRFASISAVLFVFFFFLHQYWTDSLDLIVAHFSSVVVVVAAAVTHSICVNMCLCVCMLLCFFNTIGLWNIIIFVIYISAYSVVCCSCFRRCRYLKFCCFAVAVVLFFMFLIWKQHTHIRIVYDRWICRSHSAYMRMVCGEMRFYCIHSPLPPPHFNAVWCI